MFENNNPKSLSGHDFSGNTQGHSPKILLVDDDPLMHRLFKHHLERAGYQTVVGSNRADALSLVEKESPELIVMDIMMPNVNGLEAIRRLKRNELTQHIPVLVITANAEYYHTGRLEALGSGASAFLTKPLSPARLLAEVQRLVEHSQLAA